MGVPAVCTLGAVSVGCLVDHLEVAAQLGDESLTGRRAGTAPKVLGSKHIAQDGLMLGLQRHRLHGEEWRAWASTIGPELVG